MGEEKLFFLNAFHSKKKYLALLLGLVAIFIGSYLFLLEKPINIEDNLNSQKEEKEVFSIPEILGKSLFLKPLTIEPSFPDLSNQMQIWVYEARPDDEAKNYLEIMLLSERQCRVIKSGEVIYLNYDNGYFFSDTPTSFWITPSLISSKIIKVKIGATYFDINNEKKEKEEYFELIAENQSFKDLKELSEDTFFSLKEAIWLGPDLFLEIYGNNVEKELSKKNRLIFSSGETHFIQEGDILVYKEGAWHSDFCCDDTKIYPIARIATISKNRAIEIDVWLADEIKKNTVTIFKESPPSSFRASEDFITDINVRTQKQISCTIGRQRFIIKEKDILIKKKDLWKKVKFSDFKNLADADEYFVFDSLNAAYPSKVFGGYLFNKDRTQVIKIEKNITNKTFRDHSNKKRR